MQVSFFFEFEMNKCLERVDDRHFCNLEVFSYAVIARYRPNWSLFFFPFSFLFIVASRVCVAIRRRTW